jgi:hypothetical protein
MKKNVLVPLALALVALCVPLAITACGSTSQSGTGTSSDLSTDYGSGSGSDYGSGSSDDYVDEEYLTGAEQRYINGMRKEAKDLGWASDTISSLASEWPWSDEQVIKIGGALAQFRVSYGTWKDRSAPSARLRPLRRLWVGSLASLNQFSKLFAAGADSMDAALIGKANKSMRKGTRLATRAADEADTLEALYGEY